MRYAVYVEGQSEMLFVADVLQKYSNYDSAQCGFLCINLNADVLSKVSYPQQGSPTSVNYYQIVNVNNDTRVVSKINKDIPNLIEKGYNVIIGLRDVFSENYERIVGKPIIDRKKIEEMHLAQTSCVNTRGGDFRLHFAIMEYETWMLALIENYVKNNGKDLMTICQQLKVDISGDPEMTVYHPYPLVRKIFQACGDDYHKHGKESHSFLSTVSRSDYEKLRQSGRCPSFKKFLDSLLGEACPALP